MGDVDTDRLRAMRHQGRGRVAQSAARIDDVVDQNAVTPLHVTDHVHHLGHASALAALIDDSKVGMQLCGNRARAHHAADIGRDHHDVATGVT